MATSIFDEFLLSNNVEEEKKKIDAMIQKIQDHEAIKLKDATTRNLIFVGKTRAGKTTALKVLKSPTMLVKHIRLFADTEHPTLYPFTVENTDPKIGELVNYNINIIDTPGLFEQYEKQEDIRDNSRLMSAIATCMEMEITKIHAIFFVCSFATGINDQDLKAFKEFVQLFKGAEDKIVMLITNCEEYDDKAKEELKDEIIRSPEYGSLVELIGKKIFFVGAGKQLFYDQGQTSAIASTFMRVMYMRQELYKFIFGLGPPCQLDNLDYFKAQQKKAEDLATEVETLTNKLWKTAQSEEELQTSKENLRAALRDLERYKQYVTSEFGQKKLEEASVFAKTYLDAAKKGMNT